eukprot:g12814.t1
MSDRDEEMAERTEQADAPLASGSESAQNTGRSGRIRSDTSWRFIAGIPSPERPTNASGVESSSASSARSVDESPLESMRRLIREHADMMARTATLEIGQEIDRSNVDLAFRVAKGRLMRTEGLVENIRAEFSTAAEAIGDVKLQLLEGAGNLGRNFDQIVRRILDQEVDQRTKSTQLLQELAQQKNEGGLRAQETKILHSAQQALSAHMKAQEQTITGTVSQQQEQGQATINSKLLTTLSALEAKVEQLQSSSEAGRRSSRSTPIGRRNKEEESLGGSSSSGSESESGSEATGSRAGGTTTPGGRQRSNSFAFGSAEETSTKREKGKRGTSERRNSEPNVGERGTIGGGATVEHFNIGDSKKTKREGGLNPDPPAFTPDMAGMVTPGTRTRPQHGGTATPGAASSSGTRTERGAFVIGEAVTQQYDGQEITDSDSIIDPKCGLVGVLPKFTIELQSEYDLTGAKYSRKELDKTRLAWKDAKSMLEPFNADNHATLRAWQSHLVEVISACLQGKMLKTEFEQSLPSMIIMRDGHSADQRALLYNTGVIAKEVTATHRLRSYFQALTIAFPKLTSDLATRVARWDHLNGTWMVSGADLVAELLRFATAAKGVGTQLNAKGPLAQMLLLRELAMRIKLPGEVLERVCQEKHTPTPTLEALLEYATRKKTLRTAIHLGNPDDKKKMAAANTLSISTLTPTAAAPTTVSTVGAGSNYYKKFGPQGAGGGGGEKEKLCKSCGVRGDHWASECKLPKQCGACGAPGPPPGHSYDSCPVKHKSMINFTKFLRQNRGKGKGKGKGRNKVTARAFDAGGNVVDEITLFEQEEESKEEAEDAAPGGTAPTLLTEEVAEQIKGRVASVTVLCGRVDEKKQTSAEKDDGETAVHLTIFDDDSGFTGMIFAGSRWVASFLKFLEDKGVAVEAESCAIEADTAGGVTTVVQFGVVPYGYGSISSGKAGVAELIAVDDSSWGKEAAKLVGLKLKLAAGIDTDCSSEVKGVRWGKYFAPRKQYRLPVPIFDGLTDEVLESIAQQQKTGKKLPEIMKNVEKKFHGPQRVNGVQWGLDEWEEDEKQLARPRKIEQRGLQLLHELLAPRFDVYRGHEIRADIFARFKAEGGSSGRQGGWLPLQVKVTGSRSKTWDRKMRHLFRHDAEALRGVVVVGVSLDPMQDWFVHSVHKKNNYTDFDATLPAWNYPRTTMADRLAELWKEKSCTLYSHPSRSFVYSQATLTEVEAREEFLDVLAGTGVRFELSRKEFGCVDGLLYLADNPDYKYRVQEKVLCWRMEGDEALGLRVSLRRSNGENYKPGDADFLLLHARDREPGTCERFHLFGSALVPFEDLSAHGMLHKSKKDPGCSILALYPNCPGVKTVRDGWAEKCFHERSKLALAIRDELTTRNPKTD